MKATRIKNIGITLSFVLVLLGLLIGTYYLTKPMVDKKAMQGKIDMYSEIINGIDTIENALKSTDANVILDKQIAKNANNQAIATLYHAFTTNGYASSETTGIDLLVAVDTTGKIVGLKATIDQSIGADKTKAYVESFKGALISTPNSIDGVSRPTVEFTLADVDVLLKAIADSHGIVIVEKSVYEELFGDDFVLGTKEVINEQGVKHVYTISGSKETGKVFYLEGIDYFNGPNSTEKTLGVRIILNNDNELIGYDFDDEEVTYEHTDGFQRHVKTFLDGLIGSDMTELANDIDTTTGATYSKGLAYELLQQLRDYLKEANNE